MPENGKRSYAKSFGDVPVKGWKVPTMDAGEGERPEDCPDTGAADLGCPPDGLLVRFTGLPRGEVAGDAPIAMNCVAC